jgi:hypothetical protein
LRQRGLLLLRFWGFLVIAIVAGVLVFGLVISAGAWLGSVLPALVFIIAQFLWTVIAIIVATTIGSAVWNLLYWVSGPASLVTDERLELPAFGRAELEDEKPYWATSKAANASDCRMRWATDTKMAE